MTKKLYFLVGIVALLFGQSVAMAEGGDLWRLGEKNGFIKIFIREPANESGQSRVIRDNFKKALEASFLNRKSMKFEITKTPEESDVQIYSIIKKFIYMEKGPFKPTPGIGTTLLDAAATATANYAEMTVEFAVISSPDGKLLWKETLNPYIKEKMDPEESVPIICKKIASNFIWKCFGKPSD